MTGKSLFSALLLKAKICIILKKREAPSETFTFKQTNPKRDGVTGLVPTHQLIITTKTREEASHESLVEEGMQKKFNKESHARGKAIRVKIMMKILSRSLNPLTGARRWKIAVVM